MAADGRRRSHHRRRIGRHRQSVRRPDGAVLGLLHRLGHHHLARQRQGHGLYRPCRRGCCPSSSPPSWSPGPAFRSTRRGGSSSTAPSIMPISFFCLANGPKYISGPEVAMFYLLETVLAPVWVWMIFAEVPTRNSLIGGMILIVTLVAHSTWQLIEGRKRRADSALNRRPKPAAGRAAPASPAVLRAILRPCAARRLPAARWRRSVPPHRSVRSRAATRARSRPAAPSAPGR